MKLHDLLTNLFDNSKLKSETFDIFDNTLDNKMLNSIKEYLNKCDEFKNVEVFDIIEIPDVENETGKIIQSKTFKLTDDFKFGKKCYMHSISITPEIFDPKTIHNPVKDGACITPTIYDPKTFEPKRKICIEFSPEVKQDIVDGDNKKTQELIELFTRVIKNPEEYRIKGIRSFLIRGIFDEVTLNDKTYKEDIGELNLDYENQKHFMIAYLKSLPDANNNITLNICKEYLPNKLKEKFMETFNDNQLINEENLNKFLEENSD